MISLNQAVIVEGKYDKIKLSSIIDAPIITTDGFAIFKNREKQNLIRKLALKRGIIILTDSDSAGMMIRNRVCQGIPKECVTNVYIPEIFGKEKRKRHASKEGTLGVEGVPVDVIKSALDRAGVFSQNSKEKSEQITKTDLFVLGLSGGENSEKRRRELLCDLNLPSKMSANALLDVLNVFYTRQEFMQMCEKETGENQSGY